MNALEPRLRAATRQFWKTRRRQSASQGTRSGRDRGARSAVTGGKQMDGVVLLLRDLLLEAGIPESSIFLNSRIELPGWYRAEKKWDLVVIHAGELIAALECKSQIGPSFGNNFNNRTEEAIGSAADIWAAYREGAFKPSSRPFLGYLMLLEDCDRSRSPVKVAEPHYRVFGEFRDASYCQRYAILIEKLLRERLYDGACLLFTSRHSAASGSYSEPNAELTFSKLVDGLRARANVANPNAR